MRRGKVVKSLTPVARPFCDYQVRGLWDCTTERADYWVLCSTLCHGAPVPLPVVHTPLLCSLDADRWGPRSLQNGHSQPQWRSLRPGTHSLGVLRPQREPGVLCPYAHFQERTASLATATRWNPSRSKPTPLRQPKLFISCEVKSFSCVRLFVTPWTAAYQAPSMEFSRQEYWSERVAISFSRGSSQPRDRTWVSRTAGRCFNVWTTIKAVKEERCKQTRRN